MDRKYLDYLRSPLTGEQLSVNGSNLVDASGNIFPVVNDIPRFVEDSNYTDNFGFQWNVFSDVQIDKANSYEISENRFYESLNIRRGDLKGKRVLEVGSGAGRFTEILLKENCELFSIDYSSAVNANRLNNGDSFFLAQADIYKLPFEKGAFDFVLCLGVIQHTPNVEKSFLELVDFVRPGGKLIVDVYAKNWKTPFNTRFWFRPLTTRISNETLLRVIKWYVPKWFPISCLLLKVPLIGKFLAQVIPISNYSRQYPFMKKDDLIKWAILDTFDMLSPQFDNPQSLNNLRKFAIKSEIEIEYLGKGQNGYLIRGVKPF